MPPDKSPAPAMPCALTRTQKRKLQVKYNMPGLPWPHSSRLIRRQCRERPRPGHMPADRAGRQLLARSTPLCCRIGTIPGSAVHGSSQGTGERIAGDRAPRGRRVRTTCSKPSARNPPFN